MKAPPHPPTAPSTKREREMDGNIDRNEGTTITATTTIREILTEFWCDNEYYFSCRLESKNLSNVFLMAVTVILDMTLESTDFKILTT